MINNFALIVGNVVILEQVFANIEVVRLHLALRFFDLSGQQLALNGLAFAHSGTRQQRLGALRVAEYSHERIFHRQIESA